MKRKRSIRIMPVTCLIILALMFLSALTLDAQTRKRKKTSSRRPVPVSTPPQTEPVVISRADDFPEGGQVTVQTLPPQTAATTAQDETLRSLEELERRIKSLESTGKKDPDAKQKRLLLNLDILTRAEQRSDTLRKQLFEMIEKENTIKMRLDAIDSEIRPESIEKSVAFAGSLRPEELRAARKKSLEAERANLQNLLTEIQRNRASLEQSVQKADALVERLRTRLEKEIDSALEEDSDVKPEQ